jgi:Flp pilus assembly protein TadG
MKKPRSFLPIKDFQNRAISALIHRTCGVAKDCTGTAAIEFALVLPLLLTIMMGIIQFALIFNNISVLTNATAAGGLVFSQSRGLPTPYTTTVTDVQSAAQTLVLTNLTITTSVQGAVCSTDAACLTALNTNPGGYASVTVTYPCPLILSVASLQYFGISTTFCPLQSAVTESIQ